MRKKRRHKRKTVLCRFCGKKVSQRFRRGIHKTCEAMEKIGSFGEKKIAPGIVNVKDFGAKGDGVTDDSASFQAAMNYAQCNGVAHVYVPRGRYNNGKLGIIQTAKTGAQLRA